MSNLITQKDLETIVKRINIVTNSPLEPYTRRNGKVSANIGCYHLSYAYGGVALHRMQTESGGVKDVFYIGYCTKRELYGRLHSFIAGLNHE